MQPGKSGYHGKSVQPQMHDVKRKIARKMRERAARSKKSRSWRDEVGRGRMHEDSYLPG